MESKKKEIFKFLTLIFSSIFCAFVFTAYMLYYHGPTGKYTVQNVLVSPDVVKLLSYQELNSQLGKSTNFIFKEIELSYSEGTGNKNKTVLINFEKYKKIYDLIKADESLSKPFADIENLFYRQMPATLSIKVKPEFGNDLQASAVVFQEIQWAKDSSYYRIHLREQKSYGSSWIYFEHANVYPLIINILVQP